MRAARLMVIGLLVAGCGGPAATPIVIYVTPPAAATPTAVFRAAAATPAQTVAIDRSHGRDSFIDCRDGSVRQGVRRRHLSVGGGGCEGDGGYSDIGDGMQATLRDSQNNILGIGNFSGQRTAIAKEGSWTTQCEWTTSIAHVSEQPFYALDLGRRGSIQFALDELKASGWVASVSIGNH
jgi:hypothetical protein